MAARQSSGEWVPSRCVREGQAHALHNVSLLLHLRLLFVGRKRRVALSSISRSLTVQDRLDRAVSVRNNPGNVQVGQAAPQQYRAKGVSKGQTRSSTLLQCLANESPNKPAPVEKDCRRIGQLLRRQGSRVQGPRSVSNPQRAGGAFLTHQRLGDISVKSIRDTVPVPFLLSARGPEQHNQLSLAASVFSKDSVRPLEQPLALNASDLDEQLRQSHALCR
mmetsp:Transcript_11362/g.25853  ORF Transcript_11362/g.25853 Transcript_11362/m.25853 type:complete len:220 (-) Transcript_11362:443-1102(-)